MMRNGLFFSIVAGAMAACLAAFAQGPGDMNAVPKEVKADIARNVSKTIVNPKQQVPRWALKLTDVSDPIGVECNGAPVRPVMLLPGKAYVDLSACFERGKTNKVKLNFGNGNARVSYEVQRSGVPARTLQGPTARKDCAAVGCAGRTSEELEFLDP